jgi:hypothetical protein
MLYSTLEGIVDEEAVVDDSGDNTFCYRDPKLACGDSCLGTGFGVAGLKERYEHRRPVHESYTFELKNHAQKG